MTTPMTSTQKTLIQAAILVIVLSAPILFAQNNVGKKQLPAISQTPGLDRTNSTSLEKVKSESSTSFINSQTGQATQQAQNAPVGTIQDDNIYQNSIILQHGDTHTLLPLHAVIHLPASLQNKITTQAKGDFVAWPEFYINNRNWLFTYQIGLKQAAGTAPIKPEVIEQFKKINRVVIAIYQHCPISSLATRSQ